MTRGYKTQDE
jgi:hypothetical protein